MTKGSLMKALRKVAEHKQYGGFFEYGADPAYYTKYVESGGNVALLTTMSQGAGGDDRVGTKATGTSLRLKLLCSPDQAYTGVRNVEHWLRMIVFIWKDDDIPGASDLIRNYGTAPAGIWPFEPYDPDKKIKSKILLDVTYGQRATKYVSGSVTGDAMISSNVPLFREFKFNLTKLRRGLNVVNFQQVSSTLAVNHIYILLKSNIPTASQSSAWDVFISSDYRFIDM